MVHVVVLEAADARRAHCRDHLHRGVLPAVRESELLRAVVDLRHVTISACADV